MFFWCCLSLRFGGTITNRKERKTTGGVAMSDRDGDFVKGLLIGGILGAVAGILFAPKSGKETREDIARKADELVTKAKEEYEEALERSKKTYEAAVGRLKELETSAREKVEETEARVSKLASQGREALQESKNRLKKAIDAGVEAYREEKEKAP
jgi:gas vesicle protein